MNNAYINFYNPIFETLQIAIHTHYEKQNQSSLAIVIKTHNTPRRTTLLHGVNKQVRYQTSTHIIFVHAILI
jgi:hypothetical protein